jgi:class 3 adenylate cyclase
MRGTTPQQEGMVIFFFTDIEGSTQLWEQYPDRMGDALAHHDDLLRQITQTCGGMVFKTVGDECCAAFDTARDAVCAALESQRALRNMIPAHPLTASPRHPVSPSPAHVPIKVRMALHAGVAQWRDGDYFGPVLNRVARLLAVAHGGQTLLSQPTREMVGKALPDGASLRDLGMHRLKGLRQPERIFQLLHPDLPADFPPLRSLEAFAEQLPSQVTPFIGREREMADKRGIVAFLEGRASIAGAQGQLERAVELFAAAAALRDAFGASRSSAERAEYERQVAATGTQLGHQAFATSWATGRAMSLEQAVACALEVPGDDEPPF